jgi:hypothetical protein
MPIAPVKTKSRCAVREVLWPIVVLATSVAATQAVSIIEFMASH